MTLFNLLKVTEGREGLNLGLRISKLCCHYFSIHAPIQTQGQCHILTDTSLFKFSFTC